MTCSGPCDGIDDQFDRKTAQRELQRFRRRGPIRTTKRLIDALRSAGISGATILDIGGGIGAIHHTLLDAGASTAMQVDASFEYIQSAREETARNGHSNRVLFLRGDFVQWAANVPDADIVTLDRVICCYADMESLVRNAAAKSRRLLGAVYPRDTWWVRFGVRSINAILRMRGSRFQAYAHSPEAIDAVLRSQGLERISAQRTLVWDIAVFTRRGAC
jgi:predicted TPR repeat methyltransferase